ncbi:hypothetical protein SUDANB105_03360 [Streptomyces sp. enrichment culture]
MVKAMSTPCPRRIRGTLPHSPGPALFGRSSRRRRSCPRAARRGTTRRRGRGPAVGRPGDSYTAGVILAPGNTFEVPHDGCERTDRSYPQVIDRDLYGLFELTNVSCGAATCRRSPRGWAPTPTSSPSAWAETPSPCKDAPAAGIPDRLKKVRREYERMLAVLHERAPHTKILAVGYPTVIPQDPVPQPLRQRRLQVGRRLRHPPRPAVLRTQRPRPPQRRRPRRRSDAQRHQLNLLPATRHPRPPITNWPSAPAGGQFRDTAVQRTRTSGTYVIHLPPAARNAVSFAMISSAWFQAKRSA